MRWDSIISCGGGNERFYPIGLHTMNPLAENMLRMIRNIGRSRGKRYSTKKKYVIKKVEARSTRVIPYCNNRK